MANVIDNPIIVDTAGAAMVFDAKIYVISVKWYNPNGSPSDLAEIDDRDGDVLWKCVCPGLNFDSGPQKQERWWNDGFKVPVLDSGELHITWR
jgi:hypothetical protein